MRKKYNHKVHKKRNAKFHKYMKRCLPLIITTEMQIKTTMGYYFSPIRLAEIQMTTFSIGSCGEIGIVSCIVGGNAKMYD